ncbi:MAG TPA: type II secretion system protein [Gammaproteobacteria bacterium]|nr:type II secretion system protein [Gammaproteobacteria bacterium]
MVGRRERGFSLIELAVVVCAIGILAGLALERLLPLIGSAERVAFLQVQGELQSALLLEAADRIAHSRGAELAALTDTNPMALLLKPPSNYAGEIELAQAGDVPGNTWYYDAARHLLVYRIGRYTRFERLAGPRDRIEFRVSFVYRDRDGDRVFEPADDDFDGLRLDTVYAYRWAE